MKFILNLRLVDWETNSVKSPQPAELIGATLNSYLVAGVNPVTSHWQVELCLVLLWSSPDFLYCTSYSEIDESGGMGPFHDKVTSLSVTFVTINSFGLEGSIGRR